MGMRYSSGNNSTIERGWTYQVLMLGLEYAVKLRESGLLQNYYLWELKHRIEAYYFGRNALYSGPNGVPYVQIRLWSKRALEEYSDNRKNTKNLVKEHGTPRTPFAIKILNLYVNGSLTEGVMNDNIDRYYKIAVITRDEDRRLNRIGARSKMYTTPEERWIAAGTEIVSRK
jgi:hypothetical protein